MAPLEEDIVGKIEVQKAITHLRGKWGEDRRCPMCGAGNWNVQDAAFEIREYHGSGLVVGGPVIPVIPVVCANCGNTILLNAIVAGVVASPSRGDQ